MFTKSDKIFLGVVGVELIVAGILVYVGTKGLKQELERISEKKSKKFKALFKRA